MIKGWKVRTGAVVTWLGPADAWGRVPRGHGTVVYSDGTEEEGAVDSNGLRQGQWVRKKSGGGVLLRFVDDVAQDAKACPPRAPAWARARPAVRGSAPMEPVALRDPSFFRSPSPRRVTLP